jgi:hypothetical protein
MFTVNCLNKLRFAYRELVLAINESVRYYRNRPRYMDGLQYILILTIQEFDPMFV